MSDREGEMQDLWGYSGEIVDSPMPMAADAADATHGNGVHEAEPPPMSEVARRGAPRQLPGDCRRILIVGAGGFGREVLQWTRDTWPDRSLLIGGFLSDDPRRLDGFPTNVGIVSTVQDYRPAPGDYLLLAIGVPYSRRRVAERLHANGCRFLTLVHPLAVVADTSIIGEGSIVCPFAVVSDSVSLGRCVIVNYHASLGHDATAGDYAVLSPYATLGGNARIHEEVFLGLHASVGPGRSVGVRSKVSANSCVLTTTPADSIVYGVPGRVARRIDVTEQ